MEVPASIEILVSGLIAITAPSRVSPVATSIFLTLYLVLSFKALLNVKVAVCPALIVWVLGSSLMYSLGIFNSSTV